MMSDMSYRDCKYRKWEYCTNPIRDKETNGSVLLFCLELKCTYNALKNSGDVDD